jgi:hypothetical protein
MANDGALHVVFDRQDKWMLRDVFDYVGRTNAIACFDDDLSFGPIDNPDYDRRVDWLAESFGFTGWHRDTDHYFQTREERYSQHPWGGDRDAETAFWLMPRGEYSRVVLWLTQRSARHLCGAMEWLRRTGSLPCEIVDFTEHQIRDNPYAKTYRHVFDLLDLGRYKVFDLLDTAVPMQDGLRAAWRERWEQLRADNAPLRIIGPDGLQSAPITEFDQSLLETCRYRSQKVAMLVRRTIDALEKRDVRPPDFLVLTARFQALANAGRLQLLGVSCFAPGACELQLPPDLAANEDDDDEQDVEGDQDEEDAADEEDEGR